MKYGMVTLLICRLPSAQVRSHPARGGRRPVRSRAGMSMPGCPVTRLPGQWGRNVLDAVIDGEPAALGDGNVLVGACGFAGQSHTFVVSRRAWCR